MANAIGSIRQPELFVLPAVPNSERRACESEAFWAVNKAPKRLRLLSLPASSLFASHPAHPAPLLVLQGLQEC